MVPFHSVSSTCGVTEAASRGVLLIPAVMNAMDGHIRYPTVIAD